MAHKIKITAEVLRALGPIAIKQGFKSVIDMLEFVGIERLDEFQAIIHDACFSAAFEEMFEQFSMEIHHPDGRVGRARLIVVPEGVPTGGD